MLGLIKKIKSAFANSTTYRVGLLQSRAYRVLKYRTAEVLAPSGISTFEWALLGLLFDNRAGLRASVVAEELGVEPPFVTELSQRLTQKGVVQVTKDATDQRVRLLSLTAAGEAFVQKTETLLRHEMKSVVAGISAGDLLAYLTVIEKIGALGKHLKETKHY